VRSKKKRQAIAAADVPRVFNDERVEQLAAIGQLPDSADRRRFGESLREAALIYARDARSPTVGTIRDEIAALYNAVELRKYERAAELLARLSSQAHCHLTARLKLPSVRDAGLKMPSVEELLDPARRDAACDMIERICRVGVRYVEGRRRSSGKRSKKLQPVLFAPLPNEHPPKREAERQFVMHLQSAWLEAVGKPPTATVNPSRSDRPFANLVRECLMLVGAPQADAVGLINKLQGRRRKERRRLADLRRNRRREAKSVKKTS
jgi:hypothetical protein